MKKISLLALACLIILMAGVQSAPADEPDFQRLPWDAPLLSLGYTQSYNQNGIPYFFYGAQNNMPEIVPIWLHGSLYVVPNGQRTVKGEVRQTSNHQFSTSTSTYYSIYNEWNVEDGWYKISWLTWDDAPTAGLTLHIEEDD